jgi:cysteine synthase
MPKAPKNAPPDQHASEAGLAVTPDDVTAAAAAISSSVIVTECDLSRTLSEICGCNLWLKFENLQFTSTFKERGALNRLLALSPDERQRGVIAMSAGNHAQGVAYHAHRLGVPAMIVMPVGTPMVKIENTRRHGAETIISGKTLEEAAEFARTHGKAKDLTMIHPYDDPHVIAGQGTIALEMLAAVPQLDTLVVPIGGGGLISGMAVAAKSLKPELHIVGVQAQLYPSMFNAIKGESLPMRGDTLAEGSPSRRRAGSHRNHPRSRRRHRSRHGGPDRRAVAMLIAIRKPWSRAPARCLAAVWQRRIVCRAQCRPRVDRRQHRYAVDRLGADPRTRARGAIDADRHRHRRPARPARRRLGATRRSRRQHHRGLASAHLLRPARQGHAARSRDRNAGPRASG